MFGIMLSALFSALGFLVRSIVVKFVVFFALFFVVSEFIPILVAVTGLSASGLNALFDSIPEGIYYFWNIFNFNYGFSALISAWVTRFIIRRIPVIG